MWESRYEKLSRRISKLESKVADLQYDTKTPMDGSWVPNSTLLQLLFSHLGVKFRKTPSKDEIVDVKD